MCNKWMISTLAFVASGVALAIAQEETTSQQATPASRRDQDEQAIRVSAEEFKRAFDAGDAAAIASLYTADAEYVTPDGTVINGRDSIEQEYASFFEENPGSKIRIATTSLRFAGPNVAIEDGTTQVLPPPIGPPAIGVYTVVLVKQDGKWLTASCRESYRESPSLYENLRALEPLLGSWVVESEGRRVETNIEWVANKSFIKRTYTVQENDHVVSSGLQIIGWDPANRQVISWMFDSSGGYGQGVWTQDEKGWIVEATGVLRDGGQTTATYLLSQSADDAFTWQSIGRTVDGERLPDSAIVEAVRMHEND